MRFLPLVPSDLEAAPWLGFRDAELEWRGSLHPGWTEGARRGFGIHALHLRPLPWKESLVEEAARALSLRLGIDFLVLRADAPTSRWGKAGFFGVLEALLEAATPMGAKVVLRPPPGSVAALLDLLQEAKADAVGWCWDEGLAGELDLLADRLRCAVGTASTNAKPLQQWGYRWNLAVPGVDPAQLAGILEGLKARHPAVLFPAEMPSHALGRPVVPDPEVTLGRIWDRGEP